MLLGIQIQFGKRAVKYPHHRSVTVGPMRQKRRAVGTDTAWTSPALFISLIPKKGNLQRIAK